MALTKTHFAQLAIPSHVTLQQARGICRASVPWLLKHHISHLPLPIPALKHSPCKTYGLAADVTEALPIGSCAWALRGQMAWLTTPKSTDTTAASVSRCVLRCTESDNPSFRPANQPPQTSSATSNKNERERERERKIRRKKEKQGKKYRQTTYNATSTGFATKVNF